VKFFEGIGRVFNRAIELLFIFLLSPAAPVVLGILLFIILSVVAVKLYRRGRDAHLGQVTFERSFSFAGVYAGEEVELIETVTNHGFFPMIGLTVDAYLYNELRISGFDPPKKDGMQLMTERFTLWPYMRIRRRHKVRCQRRGAYRVASVAARTRLGEYYFDSPAEIRVYPFPIPSSAISDAAGRMQGDEKSRIKLYTDPFTNAGVRDYRFGDSMSSVNFKASARTWFAGTISGSPLKVNARDFCSNRRLCVFMDFHLERDSGIDGKKYNARIEAGLSYSAALIREAIELGFAAGFVCNCKQADGSMALRFPVGGGRAHMISIFDGMAEIMPEDGASYPMLLEEAIASGTSDCEIVSIVLCPSERTDGMLSALSKLGNNVRSIVLNEIDEEWVEACLPKDDGKQI